jgi:hypothetical protein
LRKRSPLAALLSSVFEGRGGRQENGSGLCAGNAAVSSGDEDHGFIPLVASAGRNPYAARGGL